MSEDPVKHEAYYYLIVVGVYNMLQKYPAVYIAPCNSSRSPRRGWRAPDAVHEKAKQDILLMFFDIPLRFSQWRPGYQPTPQLKAHSMSPLILRTDQTPREVSLWAQRHRRAWAGPLGQQARLGLSGDLCADTGAEYLEIEDLYVLCKPYPLQPGLGHLWLASKRPNVCLCRSRQ